MMTRIGISLVAIPAIVGCIWMGGPVFAFVVLAVSTLALKEYYDLATAKQASPNRTVGMVWSAVMIFTTWYVPFDSLGAIGASVFVIGVLTTLSAELWRDKAHALVNTAVTVMGVAYVVFGLACLVAMRAMPESSIGSVTLFGDLGAALVLIAFVSVWTCDSAAYFVGLAIGRHKLFPRVSPKKSWEGAIAGGIAAIAAFVAMSAWLMPQYPWQLAVIAGLIVGAFGQLGDLAESLLKRDAAIKDSSTLIPGHGGFLDRFDSMFFVAPLLLMYMLVAFEFVWPVVRMWTE